MAGGRGGPHKSPPTVLAKPVGWLIAEPGGERERQSRPRQWRACPSPPRYPCRSATLSAIERASCEQCE
jgi:hypothetical protein